MNTCGDCRFFAAHPRPSIPRPGACKYDAPQVVVLHVLEPPLPAALGMLPGAPQQQPRMVERIDSAWPPVLSITPSCGKFERVVDRVQTNGDGKFLEGVTEDFTNENRDIERPLD